MKIVKKLLPILCLCTVLTACGSGQVANEEQSDITLGDLAAANATETILKGHRTKEVNMTCYNEDGSADMSIYKAISIGENGYETTYEDSYGYTEFQKGNRMYIFNPEDNSFSIRLFIEHQMETYIKTWEAEDLAFWQDEEIVENYIKDGVGTMVTEIPVSANDTYLGSYFDEGKYDTIHFVYNYNPQTLEIEKYSEVAHSSEAELVLTEGYITYTEEGLSVPEFVTDLQKDKATYNVRLHGENGEISEYALPKKASFQIFPTEGYTLYTDAQGTKLVEDMIDMPPQDTDLWLLP